MWKNEYGKEVVRHFQSGRHDVDRLNEASRKFINEYAKVYPKALCINVNTGESFSPNSVDTVLNFSCDVIINAAVADMAKIAALMAQWKLECNLRLLERIYREFEKAEGENIFWS